MIQIGSFKSNNILFLAPMAGVTDLPFRQLCKDHGAGWVVSEMVWSHKHLYQTTKTQRRLDHGNEVSPKIIQIAGGEPDLLAEAAQFNVEKGADIIDINMGCPAKKVCNKLAGSALMQDELLVTDILKAVVNAVDVPVTLKIRTGWSQHNKNALNIAKIAENEGISALTIHGRTKEQKYLGEAEYDIISDVKQALQIPIIANGDITSPQKAKKVLDYTKADAIMIGRGAHGNPWLFEQTQAFLQNETIINPPTFDQKIEIIIKHIHAIHSFYGDYLGVRFSRKHVGWYFENIDTVNLLDAKKQFNKLLSPDEQIFFLTMLKN